MSRALASIFTLAFCALPGCARDHGGPPPASSMNAAPVVVVARRIGVSGELSCAIGDDARVRCWGCYPQPPLQAPTPFGATPVLVSGVPEATTLAVDALRACAVATNGDVYCWGDNSHGELGMPPDDIAHALHTSGARVAGLGAPAVDVVIGESSACALLATGEVACWGDDTFSALPVPAPASYQPVLVPDLDDAVLLRGGGLTTCVARRDGSVLCWGEPSYGQVGPRDGARTHVIAMPAVVDLLIGAPTLQASFATTADGDLYQWGQGVDPAGIAARVGSVRGDRLTGGWTRVCGIDEGGALDCLRPNAPWVNEAPVIEHLLEGLPPVRELSVGDRHVCMRAMDDSLLCRGSNGRGQSALRVMGNVSASDARVVTNEASAVARGGDSDGHFACALSGTDVLCWGDGLQGQLGVGAPTVSATPLRVPLDAASAIAAGNNDACAIAGGVVWCWGSNAHGVSDPASTDAVLSPMRIDVPPATAIVLGEMHACALTAGGVYCWGDDEHAQTSADAYADRQPPTRVNIDDVIALSAGTMHTCALRADGTVACWGDDREYQIGRPLCDDECIAAVTAGHETALESVRTPRVIAGVSGVSALHAAGVTTCASSDAGSTCWPTTEGGNAALTVLDAVPLADDGGACGGSPLGCFAIGTSPLRAIDVPTIGNALAISLDTHTGCAVDALGTLRCWGTNDTGELGDGTGWAEVPTLVVF